MVAKFEMLATHIPGENNGFLIFVRKKEKNGVICLRYLRNTIAWGLRQTLQQSAPSRLWGVPMTEKTNVRTMESEFNCPALMS